MHKIRHAMGKRDALYQLDGAVEFDKSIYREIQRLASDNELNVMLVSGHAGIGKTRSIQFGNI